jgi:eukaryotic-like serine/threonine-protein kinase
MEEAQGNQLFASRVGQVLKYKWTIDRLIGVGGMAAVYAATHRNGNRVAIKMLHPWISQDMNLCNRFLREGYAANSVDHPGTVRVLDDDATEDGSVFLVMDLLEGVSLESYWEAKNKHLSPAEVLFVADQLLDILESAHQKGIVHRDIKPDNAFLTHAGVKILDFGIARLRNPPGSASATRTGSLMGTPIYMPPEQALGDNANIDARSDLWSVGALMFTTLTGEFVHNGKSPNEVLIKAATQPPRPIRTLLPGLDASVAHVVDRALAFDRVARWCSAREMQQAVRRCVADPNTPIDAMLEPVAPALDPSLLGSDNRRQTGSGSRGSWKKSAGSGGGYSSTGPATYQGKRAVQVAVVGITIGGLILAGTAALVARKMLSDPLKGPAEISIGNAVANTPLSAPVPVASASADAAAANLSTDTLPRVPSATTPAPPVAPGVKPPAKTGKVEAPPPATTPKGGGGDWLNDRH